MTKKFLGIGLAIFVLPFLYLGISFKVTGLIIFSVFIIFIYFWYALEEFRGGSLSFKFVVTSYFAFQALSVGYTAYTETERLEERLETEKVAGRVSSERSLESTYIPYEFFWQKD